MFAYIWIRCFDVSGFKGREIKSSMASGKNGKFAIVVCECNVHMTGSARDVAL